MSQSRLLVVHPEGKSFDLLASMLQALGHKIDEVVTDRAAVKFLERQSVDLVLAGVVPSDPDSLEFLSFMKRRHSGVPMILLFSQQNRDIQRDAMRMGAANVLQYPLAANDLRAAVAQVLEQYGKPGAARQSTSNGQGLPPFSRPISNGVGSGGSGGGTINQVSKPILNGSSSGMPTGSNGSIKSSTVIEPFLGDDNAIRKALDMATNIAGARTPVLIVGERGTGKTLLSRYIHQASSRRDGALVEAGLNGANDLSLERELFGTPPDSYSGERVGKIARAHLGTLVIDEIAALSLGCQAKLLRALEEGVYEPAGGGEPVRVDFRLICHTRQELVHLVERGEFLQSLYFRINIVQINLPSLRHRLTDIEKLAEQFRVRACQEHQKKITGFSADAIEAMFRHSWTGNVAELKSVVERGVVNCRASQINLANLGLTQIESGRFNATTGVTAFPRGPVAIRPLKEALESPEKDIIVSALEALNWNRQETARVLDINRTTLYKKMKKYGLLTDDRDRSLASATLSGRDWLR